jgi:HEAT repeat protein
VTVAVQGLEPLEGETAFAFMVVRLRTAVDRGGLLEVLRYIAPLIPDADAFIDEFPDELEGALRIIAIPWAPADAGLAVEIQRRLIDGSDVVGIEAAWFFQTGTNLPFADTGDDADDDDDEGEGEDDEGTRISVRRLPTSTGESRRAPTSTGEQFTLAAVSGEIYSGEVTDTQVSLAVEDETEQEDDEPVARAPSVPAGDDTWSHGPPQQASDVRFPVDDYPAIVEQLDWEDFGIAFKLAGSPIPGESTVLLGFHTLWLAPYGDRYRNTAVTIDPAHHAAHLWVDRFAVPCKPEELVHHLLWIVAKLDEVVPVLHARFAPASMTQKYGGTTEDVPFVLGGNPLLELYKTGGEAAVDAWITGQTDWAADELALMLRELAVEIVSAEHDEADAVPAQIGSDDEGEGDDDDDDDDDGDDDDDDEERDDDGDGDDDESEGSDDEDRGRHITRRAAELLKIRAHAGKLDARAADALVARLRKPNPPRALVEILGAVRQRTAVPALLEILERSIDDELVAATARALGAIGDPRAIPALIDVASARGAFVAKPAAAAALVACLAKRGVIDDAELAEALTAIIDAGDGRLDPTTLFACGRIARLLPPHRRAEARRRLLEQATSEGVLAQLARIIALQLASPAVPPPPVPAEARALLERALADGDVERLKVALEIAATVPELVDAGSIMPLTRVLDPEVRGAAHAVLARLGHPEPNAQVFDAAAAHRLDDAELIRRLDLVHVVGRDALVAEVGRRKLPAARQALLGACHAAIEHASIYEHDRRLLVAALPILARSPDAEVGAVVDRMAHHPSSSVQKLAKKWQHLRHDDERIN